jgi:vitamin B12 transporter
LFEQSFLQVAQILMKKYLFFYLLWIFHWILAQQDTSHVLKEVTIQGKKFIFERNIIEVDTITLPLVTETLERNIPITLKTYAPGGNVTFSFHGFGASHTLLLWNGFPLNSPFLGQPLIYGLPAYSNTTMYFWPGSFSSTIFLGGLGATIAINETPQKNRFSLSYGSFSTFASSLQLVEHIKKITFFPMFYFSQSKNDYTFLNNAFGTKENWYLDRRINADYRHMNFHLPFLFEKNSWRIFSSLWVKDSDMGLPTSIQTPQVPNSERWHDRSYRFVCNAMYTIDSKMNLSVAYYFSNTQAIYKNNPIHLISNTSSIQHALNLDFKYATSSSSYGKISFYDEEILLSGENYAKDIRENNAFIKGEQTFFFGHLKSFTLWNYFLKDWPYFVPGMNFQFKHNRYNFFLLYGISRNVHKPTLNDKYWCPGGNPNLKNEESWTTDLTCIYTWENKKIKATFEWRGFYHKTRNWIIWLPDSGSAFWKPQNLWFVQGKGMDVKMDISFHHKLWDLSSKGVGTYQHVMQQQKELMYVPRWKVSETWQVSFKKTLSLTWSMVATGKRFTNMDNTRYMPYYIVHDVSINIHGKTIHRYVPDLSLICNNIFNANYQEIAWFPMPRSNYQIQLLWTW